MAVDWEIVSRFAQPAATLVAAWVGWQGLKTWKRQHSFELARKMLLASRAMSEFVSINREWGYLTGKGKVERLRELRTDLESYFSTTYPLWSDTLEGVSSELWVLLHSLEREWEFLEREHEKDEPREHMCDSARTIAEMTRCDGEVDEFTKKLDAAFKELDSFLLKQTKV